jgi:hypothetical protein
LAVAIPAAWQQSMKTSSRRAWILRSAAVKSSADNALPGRSNGATSWGRRKYRPVPSSRQPWPE